MFTIKTKILTKHMTNNIGIHVDKYYVYSQIKRDKSMKKTNKIKQDTTCDVCRSFIYKQQYTLFQFVVFQVFTCLEIKTNPDTIVKIN